MPTNYRIQDVESLSAELWRLFRDELAAANSLLRDSSLTALEAVHEARRSLKRARAALRLLRGSGQGLAKSADAKVRELARLLSPYRDQDVILETIDEMLAAADEEDLSSPIRAYLWYLRAAEERKRDRLTRSFGKDAAHFARKLDAIEHEYANPSLGRLSRQRILTAFAAALETIHQRFERAQTSGQPDEFHKCRKSTQRALNQSCLLMNLDPEGAAIDMETLQALAKRLGRLQDLYVLQERLTTPAKDKLLREGARQLLVCVKGEQTRCIDEARELQLSLRVPVVG